MEGSPLKRKVCCSVLLVLSALLSIASTSAVADRDVSNQSPCTGYCIDQKLGPSLSPGASMVHNISAAPRWSEFGVPQPSTIVNVATERDVATTVYNTFPSRITSRYRTQLQY